MKKNNEISTSFLFSTSSFLLGLGSIFNIAGNYYEFNTSSNGKEADAKAIRSDWEAVGNDMKEVFQRNPCLLET